jgi:DNA repair protein RadC
MKTADEQRRTKIEKYLLLYKQKLTNAFFCCVLLTYLSYMTVKLTKEEVNRTINGAALYKILQRILEREALIDRQKEHLWVAGLDIQGRLLVLDLVSLGNDFMTAADPVAVFARPLQKDAKHIVLAHNHPRGSLKPSKADLEVTQRMVTSGKLLHCPLVDHMIITDTSFYSMRQHGLLEPMEVFDLKQTFDEIVVIKQLLEMKEQEMTEQRTRNTAINKQLKAEQLKAAQAAKNEQAALKAKAAEEKKAKDALKENAALKKQLAALQKKK